MMIDVEYGVVLVRYDRLVFPKEATSKPSASEANEGPALLSDLSDVIFLEWSHQKALAAQRGDPQSPNIRFILFHKIGQGTEHPEGEKIISTIFEAEELGNHKFGHVPELALPHAFQFAKAKDLHSFHGLLGTEPGKIMTKLLSEHRETLGQCRVAGVMVFAAGSKEQRSDRKSVRPSMLFKIEHWPGGGFASGSGPDATPDLSSAAASVQGAGDAESYVAPSGPGVGGHRGGHVYYLPGQHPGRYNPQVVGEDRDARQPGDQA